MTCTQQLWARKCTNPALLAPSVLATLPTTLLPTMPHPAAPPPCSALFERATHLQLPPKKMKFLFKRYLDYEKKAGDAARWAGACFASLHRHSSKDCALLLVASQQAPAPPLL